MLHDYNLAHCQILVGGIPATGFNDGDAVEVEYESDIWTEAVGSDGEVTRSATNDRRATIALHLKSSSKLNAILRQKVTLARTVGAGDVFSFMLTDIHTGDQVISPQTWVKTDPGTTKGREASDVDWVLMGADVTIVSV